MLAGPDWTAALRGTVTPALPASRDAVALATAVYEAWHRGVSAEEEETEQPWENREIERREQRQRERQREEETWG